MSKAIIESKNYIPSIMRQSRDMQIFCKLFDLLINHFKTNTDYWVSLIDFDECPDNLLPLLASYVGYKYDYKIDDPNLEKVANNMLKNLNEFIENVNKDPQKYLGDVKKKKYVVHMSAVVDNIIEGYFDSKEEAESFAISRGGALLHDNGMDGVDDEWHWDGDIDIEYTETV